MMKKAAKEGKREKGEGDEEEGDCDCHRWVGRTNGDSETKTEDVRMLLTTLSGPEQECGSEWMDGMDDAFVELLKVKSELGMQRYKVYGRRIEAIDMAKTEMEGHFGKLQRDLSEGVQTFAASDTRKNAQSDNNAVRSCDSSKSQSIV
jgi:hypothetical protein